MTRARWLILLLGVGVPALAWAAPGIPAFSSTPGPGGSTNYTFSIEALLLLTALTFLPAALLMMTAFTRIVIVLAILRQALGLTQTPPNQVLVGLALLLSFFVMAPTFEMLNREAIAPYAAGQLALEPALARGAQALHGFMLAQTRAADLKLFADLAGDGAYARPADVPLSVLAPAFVTSELKTAFQIGFMLFLPFLVIDLVVASVLMSLGMMMLSPTLISLPFKLLLFVLVDGWALTIGSLAASFAASGTAP